jgi:glyoxylase-like metal-dependent hydrolase (beta-lactamase superfamily II)
LRGVKLSVTYTQGITRENATGFFIPNTYVGSSMTRGVIEDNKRAAFVDTGCYLSVPMLLATLDEKNIKRENVDYIILTHIHLDHAGGAGELIKYLPNAKIIVHEYGANHLIDPSKLRSGVIKVYGELFFKQYLGDLIPVPKDKITIAKDFDSITLGERTLKFIDTPGHARPLICIWDEKSRGIFSGDTLAVSYSDLVPSQGELIFQPTIPIQSTDNSQYPQKRRVYCLQSNKRQQNHCVYAVCQYK